jgi:hypothetical protein
MRARAQGRSHGSRSRLSREPTVSVAVNPLTVSPPTEAQPAPAPEQTRRLALEPASCCLCGNGEVEPLAVGEDFEDATTRDSFLVVRCRQCGMVYLDPVPSPEEHDRLDADVPRTAPLRVIPRAGTRSVEIRGSLEGVAPPAVPYDLIVLKHALERAVSPQQLLCAAAAMLAPTGRMVVVTYNAGSTQSGVFSGRHWSGYAFPRHRQLFSPETFQALARTSGLQMVSLRTGAFPGGWARSLRNVLVDWKLPRYLRLALPVARPLFVGIEGIARLRGRAGLLVATLRHPPSRPAAS